MRRLNIKFSVPEQTLVSLMARGERKLTTTIHDSVLSLSLDSVCEQWRSQVTYSEMRVSGASKRRWLRGGAVAEAAARWQRGLIAGGRAGAEEIVRPS